jgi:ACR3 family arsenite efflux pump ArsB
MTSVFERYLSVWVLLCILAGILLGKIAPGVARTLDGMAIYVDGFKMLEVPLWRSYLAGCILLGIAPCTAMVLVWGFLSRGNDGLTLVMVAISSLTMLLLYGLARLMKLRYEDAAPSAMIGASNHFEAAIATSTMLFGLSSGAALATVVAYSSRCRSCSCWSKSASIPVPGFRPTEIRSVTIMPDRPTGNPLP